MYLAVLGIYLKLLSLLGVILFFSTVASPVLSMFCTIAVYIIGHSAYAILDFSLRKGNVFYEWIGRGIITLFPNLESLNLKNYVATGAPIDLSHWMIGYVSSTLYIVIILILGMILFQKKSFDTV
jgi:hypothetical protein